MSTSVRWTSLQDEYSGFKYSSPYLVMKHPSLSPTSPPHSLPPAEPATIDRVCGIPVVIGRVGEDVELSCLAESTPPPVGWVWRRRGTLLQDGEDRVTLINRGGRVGEFLGISMLQESDSGIYNCTVTTSNIMSLSFTDSSLTELQVHSK